MLLTPIMRTTESLTKVTADRTSAVPDLFDGHCQYMANIPEYHDSPGPGNN